MQPKLIQTRVAQYAPAEYHGKNESGYRALGARLIVLTDQCAEKTSGGIYIDPVAAERMTMAAETGTVVQLGSKAFSWAQEDEKPKPGDRVYIERYSGQVALGRDGQLYRILEDRCVGALMDAVSAIVRAESPLVSGMGNSLGGLGIGAANAMNGLGPNLKS